MIVFFKKYTKDDQEKKRKEINQDYWQNYNYFGQHQDHSHVWMFEAIVGKFF